MDKERNQEKRWSWSIQRRVRICFFKTYLNRHYILTGSVAKGESQEAGGENEKDDSKRKKSMADPAELGGKAGEQERRISLFIPSQDLTLSAQKGTDP